MKTKILPIKQIEVDDETYPRMQVDWVTCARYYNALRSGAKFPPITVAKFGKKHFLVDGAHRLKAHKDNKEEHISCEIIEGLDKQGIFIEAVKRNIVHGRQFSTQEITSICLTLENYKMSQGQISEIIRIPATEIKPFIAKRITKITETQEQIALKSPFKHLAGIEMESEPNQDVFNAKSQIQILNMLIVLLKNDWVDKHSEQVMQKLNKVKVLLNDY
jgi:hypothetical protein